MPERAAPIKKEPDDYYHQTRRPLNNLVLVLSLLCFFHAGALVYGSDMLLLAPQYLQKAFVMLGAPAAFVPASLPVIVVLLAQHFMRRDKWEIQPQAIAGMIGESILWTIPLVALSYVTGRIMAATAVPNHALLQKVLMAAGAGVYEEFLFRMTLISLLLLVLVDLLRLKKDPMTVIAVLAAAGVFGLAHFKQLNGAYDFRWRKFIFLTLAGTLWGALFLFRGFAVAVGSHFVWDLFAFTAYEDPSSA